MKRGIFDSISQIKHTDLATRSWLVSVIESDCYWYDLIINSPDEWDFRKHFADGLKEKKKKLKESIDRRFVYFIATRPKVRFDVSRRAKFGLFKKRLRVPVVIWPGRRKRTLCVSLRLADGQGHVQLPSVEMTETMIRFRHSKSQSYSYSIHDFLQIFDIGIDAYSQVRYVGSTKDPASRLLSRKHRGLTDVIYNVGTESHDFFVYANIFHVQSFTDDPGYNLRIHATNSLTGEFDIEDERKIIEGALIHYFRCSSQAINRGNEDSVFAGALKLLAEKKIGKVGFAIAIEGSEEYFTFFSETRTAAQDHFFSYSIENDDLRLQIFNSDVEIYRDVGAIVDAEQHVEPVN